MSVSYVGPFSPAPPTVGRKPSLFTTFGWYTAKLFSIVPGLAGYRTKHYRLRGWSASLGSYVEWTAGSIDATASEYVGAGKPITNVVLLETF
jgi:hypothetical protein